MSIKRAWPIALLALLIGAGIVEGPPASAATSVNGVTFGVATAAAGAATSMTVGFTTSNGTGGALGPGSTISVTINTAFAKPVNPVVTLGLGFAGCSATAITTGDVVAITLAGPTCALPNRTSATLTLAGITNPSTPAVYPASTFRVATSSDANQVNSGNGITITAGPASRLVFIQGPSSGFAGAALSPAITVQLEDQVGNSVSAAGVTVTLAASAGVIDSGATAATNSTGLATFSSVAINTAALGLTLTASASGLTSTGPSSVFNVTVAVSSGAALTDTAADGGGSGVKTVAYYYCAGYTGSCTSANWTPIGSATAAGTSYLVTWNSQPANGGYRLVAVGTDNVTNTSQPSTPIPVTVAN